MDAAPARRSNVRGYLDILRRRRWTVALTFIVVVGATFAALMLQPPTYVASTRVLLETDGSLTSDVLLRQLLVGERELVTQREIILSDPVLSATAERLGSPVPAAELRGRVTVDVIEDTAVLEIAAAASEPRNAATLATTIAEEYLEFSRLETLDRLARAASSIEEREAATQQQLRQVERDLRTASESERQGLLFEQQQLQAEIAGLRQQRTTLTTSAQDVGGIGRIVRAAAVPTAPAGQGLPQSVAIAVALGAAAALGLAFTREFLDDHVRSPSVAAGLAGRPVLARIDGLLPRENDEVGLVDELSEAAEGYRILRAALRSVTVDQGRPSLVVTSGLAGEGKSTTAANLAVSLARGGQRTLLVGADLRRPVLHRMFGLEGPGLADVLVGDASLEQVARRVGIDNLRVITSGSHVPNPSELLGSQRMTELVGQLEAMADVVLFDAPPILSVADGVEVARRATGVVLVVDAGLSTRSSLTHAVERLGAAPAHVVGLVMNRTPMDASYPAYGEYQTPGRRRS